MSNPDFSVKHTILNNSISFISAFTNSAQPNSETEVHAHYNEFEVYYIIEGDLYFAFEGRRYTINAGTMIIIAPGMLHRPIIKKTCKYYRKRILFSKSIFSDLGTISLALSADLLKRKIIIIPERDVRKHNLDTVFEQIEQFISEKNKHNEFSAVITICMLLINGEKISQHSDGEYLSKGNKAIEEIVVYIEENLERDLAYKTIAEKFYISEKSLYKLFKKETGFTLSNYINERRIIKAQSILNNGGTANEAASASGFNDYTSFYRSFLRKVKITPAEYIKGLYK